MKFILAALVALGMSSATYAQSAIPVWECGVSCGLLNERISTAMHQGETYCSPGGGSCMVYQRNFNGFGSYFEFYVQIHAGTGVSTGAIQTGVYSFMEMTCQPVTDPEGNIGVSCTPDENAEPK